MRESIELGSFRTVDLRKEAALPIITVYKQPKDYPTKWVARLFDINKPTKYMALGNSLEEILEKIPPYMTRFGRDPKDDPAIYAIYI